MKNIQPKQVYSNGLELIATQFNLQSTFDNLLDYANFYWQLLDENSQILLTGELKMTNPDYDLWNGDSNINNSAYQWAASLLNLTLV
jgi:hypothetical protein